MATDQKFPILEVDPDPKDLPPPAQTLEQKLISSLEHHIKTLEKENEFLRGELLKRKEVPHIPHSTITPRPLLRTTSEITKALEKLYALKDPKLSHEIKEEEK